jgi:large subunit ribosomal protein L5
MERLHERYNKDIQPQLMREFNFRNVMETPRITKVVVNIGVGSETVSDSKALDAAVNDLTKIVGQKPIITKARKSIANFKLRENKPIGVKVTLRGDAFDGRGNYTLGLREQLVFPEIEYDKIDKLRGLEISIVTTARTDEHGRRLLQLLGMPFVKKGAV